jgi:hypothetical protein
MVRSVDEMHTWVRAEQQYTWEAYNYAEQNPVGRIDPTALAPKDPHPIDVCFSLAVLIEGLLRDIKDTYGHCRAIPEDSLCWRDLSWLVLKYLAAKKEYDDGGCQTTWGPSAITGLPPELLQLWSEPSRRPEESLHRRPLVRQLLAARRSVTSPR